MRTDRLARVLTFVLLAAVIATVWVRRNGTAVYGSSAQETPQDAIYKMLDAARTGDVRAYLSYYADPMAQDLRQTIREKTENGFRQYLISFDSGIKGIAVMDPGPAKGADVTVRVEYVYADRNEAQSMRLVKQNGRWKISRIENSDRAKTLIPYGTPVE